MSFPALRRDAAGALLLRVAARPGASRSAVQGLQGDALKVAIRAAPEKGKANKELIAFLAKTLGLRRAQLTLVQGQTSRDKVVRVDGVEQGALEARLRALLAE